MRKRLTKEQKWDNAMVDIINEMFRIAGHEVTYDDIKDRKFNWFQYWSMTATQNEEWKQWGKKYLQKNLRMYAKTAERHMGMIDLGWGLILSDKPLKK